MQRAIVGTAGHIDHGKTSLVLALTGIDCDRWAEEKARGITIDLGFAHLATPDLQLGFIDVPGHERFLHNALAGLGGIRVMLLVVAADEGVKPQTREHLTVCSLLGIPAGLVALTKTDLVTPDLVELAALEVDELLAGTPYAGAAIIPVSSTTGEGLEALRAALFELAAAHAAPAGPPAPVRLPVDRAFHLRGLGVVVTGTLARGMLRVGDTVDVLPDSTAAAAEPASGAAPPRGRVRVRSIQVHGQGRESALPGERTSAQLSGVTLDGLGRGVELVTPEAFVSSTRLLARFHLLPDAPAPLAGFTPVRLHLYAREVVGRLRPLLPDHLEPGASGLVEVRLAAPLVAARGDRLIVRRPSPAATIGGGEVLDPLWRRRRGSALAAALAALARDDSHALAFWAEDSGEQGLEAAAAARRLGVAPTSIANQLAALSAEGKLVTIPEGPGHGRRWIAPGAFERVSNRARRVLKDYFARERLATAMPKAEAVRRIVRGRAAELAPIYFDWLERNKVLTVTGDQVHLPGRRAELTGEESRLSAAVLARFEAAALAPPGPSDLQSELSAKPQILDGVVRHLIAQGRLLRLPGGMVLAASAVADLRRQLLDSAWERFNVTAFKDRFNLTRKWAIPLLEHLDSVGATRRVGDERLVVRPAADPAPLAVGNEP